MASTGDAHALPQRTNRRGQKRTAEENAEGQQQEEREQEPDTCGLNQEGSRDVLQEPSTSGREHRDGTDGAMKYAPIEHVEYRSARVGSYNFECEHACAPRSW